MLKNELTTVVFSSQLNYLLLESPDPFQAIDSLAMQYLVLSGKHQSLYTDTSMDKEFNRFANQIVKRLPSTQDFTTTQLLYSSLQSLSSVTILLEQVFFMIDIIITIVAAYVIYILMLSDVKQKIFEMALLRIIGLRKHAASGILIIQVLYFTIPGIIFGLLLSVALYVLLASILNRLLLLSLPLSLPWSAYVLSVIVGLLSPLVAIAAPVVSLTRKGLSESLDYQHSDMNDTRVKVSDNRKTPITTEMILFGIILVAEGILVFVFAVDAFLNSDIKTFLGILNIILILALLGTSILSTYLSYGLSSIISFLVTRVGSMKSCLLYAKNNANLHKTANLRLSLLNTVSLTFIIFAACLLRLQVNTLNVNIKLSIPSDLLVTTSHSLDEANLGAFLSNPQNKQFIRNYEFVGKPMQSDLQLTTYADYEHVFPAIYFLRSNYLDLIDDAMIRTRPSVTKDQFKRFLEESRVETLSVSFPDHDVRSVSSPPLDLQRAYQRFVPAILPASIDSDLVSTHLNTYLLSLSHSDQLEKRFAVQKLPGFSFSKYNYIQSVPTILLSPSSFSSVFDVSVSDAYPKDRLFIQLKENLSDREYAIIVDSTRSMLKDYSDTTFAERRSLLTSIQDAQLALDIYFYVVSALCCVLLFFATWISIETSSQDTSHEIGIFQAIGGTRAKVYLVFHSLLCHPSFSSSSHSPHCMDRRSVASC
ncbi:hypothetical protein WA538_005799 [Blastocystis sp. DL]